MPKIITPTDVLLFRQRLCDLALKAFADHGVEGISLRSLAAAAGCSRTTPYRYFKDKADILAAVRQAEFERMADQLEAAAESKTDPDEQLMALARSYLDFAMERPHAYRIMYSVAQKEEQRYPELVKQIQRTQAPMRSAVEKAIAKGSIHGDPTNIVHVLWAGLHGIISLYLSDKLHTSRAFAELAQVMIRSLGQAITTSPSTQPAANRIVED